MNSETGLRRASPTLALTLLTAISVVGFIDRIIMNVLVEPIKKQFHLSDTQMGIINGIAFALLNVAFGLIIARFAERRRRLTFVAVGTLLWSVACALCGMATSYGQLVLARVGVGVGEAVGLPSTSSVVSDYFPPERRTTAMSVLSLSPPLGAFIGAAGGSLIAQAYGWQMALLAAAVPGAILAVLLHLFVAEPMRGQHDGLADADTIPPMRQVITRFWHRQSMRHLLIGSAIASMVGFGLNTFLASFLTRRFGFSMAEAGLTSGLVASLPASISVFGAGWLADRMAKRDARSYALIPAITLLLSTPLYIVAITRDTPAAAITLLGIAALVQYCYLGPTFGTFQNMMHPRMRATSSAFTSMVYALIGGGLGPLLMGMLSDFSKTRAPTPGEGLAMALALASVIYLWAALHYWLASRTIRQDLALPLED
jgi:predicted MFS family arabinose efflux permease